VWRTVKTRNWSAIRATAAPVDRVAARVMGGGAAWTPAAKRADCVRHWTEQPTDLIVPMPQPGHKGTFVDMTGRTFGRFRVVAYLGKPNRKNKARWLVKCSCGDFEERSANAIISRAEGDDMCVNCRYLEAVKRRTP
jgi:hypothetical protein